MSSHGPDEGAPSWRTRHAHCVRRRSGTSKDASRAQTVRGRKRKCRLQNRRPQVTTLLFCIHETGADVGGVVRVRPRVKANRAGTRGFRAPEVLFKCESQTVGEWNYSRRIHTARELITVFGVCSARHLVGRNHPARVSQREISPIQLK